MHRLLLIALICVAAGFSLRAQDPLTVFRAESNLVVLHVNVFDRRSDAVPDLPQESFKVFEDDTAAGDHVLQRRRRPRGRRPHPGRQRLDDRARAHGDCRRDGVRPLQSSRGRTVHDSFQREREVRPSGNGSVHQQRLAAAFGACGIPPGRKDGAVRRGDCRAGTPGIGHAPEARARRPLRRRGQREPVTPKTK